jgi:hypothetical protein
MTNDQITELRAILGLPALAQPLPAEVDPVRDAWIEAIEVSALPPSQIKEGAAFWTRAKELGWRP